MSKLYRFSISKKKLYHKSSAAFLLAITLGLVIISLVGALFLSEPEASGSSCKPLLRFVSYAHLRLFLSGIAFSRWLSQAWSSSGRGSFTASTALSSSSENVQGAGTYYSGTNVQVEGVDEADVVKTDEEYIYFISNGKLLIIRAYPPDVAEVVAQVSFSDTVRAMYINDDRLLVFAQGQNYHLEQYSSSADTNYVGPVVSAETYDITNRSSPFLTKKVTVDGSYIGSRMIGDYIYVIVASPIFLMESEEVYLPSITINGCAKKIEASSIYYSLTDDYVSTMILSVNIKNDLEPMIPKTFMIGYSSIIYASLSNIYITVPNYGPKGIETTDVHRVNIGEGEITYEVHGQVPGHVLNQFSMDEYNEHFRIATTDNYRKRNNLYILGSDLTIVGKLENLAPGESIYSARFMDDRCFLVTFKKVDPLFVISLVNPANPTVLGKLKIPGYSSYMHPYDENHLIGIGKWTIEAEEGDFAWYQGIKISLFDISDLENPIETSNVIIGDRGSDSPVLSDHKAFLFDRNRSLLAIPILVADINEAQYPNGVPANAFGDFVWQGLYVFEVSGANITIRGSITHIEDATEYLKNGYWFDSQYSVERAFYIDAVLYTLSTKRIKLNDLATLQEIKTIKLP